MTSKAPKASKVTHATCHDEAPARKKQRRDHAASVMYSQESDPDYYSDDSFSEGEIAFTSDEIENQIDEFLKTAHDTIAPKKLPPLLPLAGPSGSGACAQQQDEVSDEPLDEGLSHFAQDLATDEDYGPELITQLAEVLNNILSKKLSEEKLKTRIDENPPPWNIPLLHPPRVNEAIWEVLKAGPRSSDIRMRKIQVRLTRGLVALARLADSLLSHKKKGTSPNLGAALDMALQSFTLVGNANYELSLRRRETLRTQLNPQYGRLCYQSTPITENLFGDDITKRVEDITKVQRLGYNLGKNSNKNYNNGGRGGKTYYNNNRGGGRGRGRGRGSFNQRSNDYGSKNGKWRGGGQQKPNPKQ